MSSRIQEPALTPEAEGYGPLKGRRPGTIRSPFSGCGWIHKYQASNAAANATQGGSRRLARQVLVGLVFGQLRQLWLEQSNGLGHKIWYQNHPRRETVPCLKHLKRVKPQTP